MSTALAIVLLLSPEQILTAQLRSCERVMIERMFPPRLVVLVRPPELANLLVIRIHRSAGAGESLYRIQFGDGRVYHLWDASENHDLTTDDADPDEPLGIDLEPGFVAAMIKAVDAVGVDR
jgi:hypothetical protein